MSKKRFKTNHVGCIVDYENNLKNYDDEEIVDLLNDLDEELKIYKSKIEFKNNKLSIFDKFCRYNNYVEELREDCEKEISEFIDEEWNPNSEYYVDCEDGNILTILVKGEIVDEKESFELFIIKELCEKYELEILYIETVQQKDPYIEWGLVQKE